MSHDYESEVHTKLTLEQFLKIQGWVDSGGQAKMAIQGGEVRVNGQVDTRRRRQLVIGDRVEFHSQTAVVSSL
jgi:ribosome-associated protein